MTRRQGKRDANKKDLLRTNPLSTPLEYRNSDRNMYGNQRAITHQISVPSFFFFFFEGQNLGPNWPVTIFCLNLIDRTLAQIGLLARKEAQVNKFTTTNPLSTPL